MHPEDTTPSLQWYGNATDHPLYQTWANMKTRCYNSNYYGWANYGGRGIRVCDRWLRSFWDFIDDVGHKPAPTMSLDRIDVDGDYHPANVRWATSGQQAQNTQKAIPLDEVRGEIITLYNFGNKVRPLRWRTP